MKILAARKYPNPRNGSLNRAEAETRRIAYAIKDPRSPSADFDNAAREMALLIETPCWIVSGEVRRCWKETRRNIFRGVPVFRVGVFPRKGAASISGCCSNGNQAARGRRVRVRRAVRKT